MFMLRFVVVIKQGFLDKIIAFSGKNCYIIARPCELTSRYHILVEKGHENESIESNQRILFYKNFTLLPMNIYSNVM